jgi:2-polyprenyl-3-methyl-5-hydroxy-6-metoxy-1,4-benzoquinol methylase
MSWDSTYQDHERIWGDRPSALATFACHHLKAKKRAEKALEILDLGCGYGRDAKYLASTLNCCILGIDNSSKAIDMARQSLPTDLEPRVRFQCGDFTQTNSGKFDIVLASNFYHLLRTSERQAFRETVKKNLRPGGQVFLSTLSPRDPEHYGKGKRVENEVNSFQDEKFLHFCTKEELESDFGFLTIDELSEHEYYEPRSNGEVHHHILWILAGIMLRSSTRV